MVWKDLLERLPLLHIQSSIFNNRIIPIDKGNLVLIATIIGGEASVTINFSSRGIHPLKYDHVQLVLREGPVCSIVYFTYLDGATIYFIDKGNGEF